MAGGGVSEVGHPVLRVNDNHVGVGNFQVFPCLYVDLV